MGFDKLTLKAQSIKAQFVPGDKETYYQSDIFGKMLAFVKDNTKNCKLAETKGRLILTVFEIKTAKAALEMFRKLNEYVFQK
jgi:transcription-repair coupling factor (superfamily II helicase)